MKNLFCLLFTISYLTSNICYLFAQDNVGIGTLNPNAKALMDLTASDKGFLVPRLTSAERININPTGNSDAALLVYDTDDNLFYFWNSTQWVAFPQQGGSNNISLSFDVNTGTLSLTDNGGTLTTNIPPDNDSDPTNELITNVVFGAGNILTIEEGGNTWATTINVNDADSDPTNELQDLLLNNNQLSISITNSTVDLSPYVNTDNQTLSLTGNTLAISNGNSVDLSNIGGGDWKLLGNAGTNPATNFLGTTDNVGLSFRTNNVEQVRISPLGNVGIGIAAPAYKLDVAGTINTNVNFALGGTAVVFGTPTDVYGNFRVLQNNSTALQDGMYINYNSTGGAGADLRFYANGTTERMRIKASNGHVGIGDADPQTPFVVNTVGEGLHVYRPADNVMAIQVSIDNQWANRTTYAGGCCNVLSLQPDVGRVGIGTNDPQAKLHVTGPAVSPTGNGNRFAFNQGLGSTSSAPTTIAFFNGDVLASLGFYALTNINFSDERIKNVLHRTNNSEDLKLLNQIQITDYKFIDTMTNGSKINKKVIAQELEKIYPNAVYQKENYIPNVFEVTSNFKMVDKNLMQITVSKTHDFEAGNKIQINLPNNQQEFAIVKQIEDKCTFVIETYIDAENFEELLVYGKQVDDFRAVDYDAITTLSVSAIQELNKIIEAQQKEIELLKKDKIETERLKAKLEKLESYIFSEAKK